MNLDSFFKKLRRKGVRLHLTKKGLVRSGDSKHPKTPIIALCKKEGLGDYCVCDENFAGDILGLDRDDVNKIILAANNEVYNTEIGKIRRRLLRLT
jgi:hypothetical protein